MKLKYLLWLVFLTFSGQVFADCELIDFQSYMYEKKCNRIYAGAFGGADWANTRKYDRCLKTHLRTGFLVGGAIGFQFDQYSRIEGEIAYRKNHFSSVTISHHSYHPNAFSETLSYMVNGYVDFPVWMDITPYVGLGVGYMNSKINISKNTILEREAERKIAEAMAAANLPYKMKKIPHGKETMDGYATQFITGVFTPIADKTDIGLEYRYFRGDRGFHNQSLALTGKYTF